MKIKKQKKLLHKSFHEQRVQERIANWNAI